ncbi:helix-turn-helix transcriptional regulator [uncultured Eudoraea sp.]|uniref:helix-turn-helix transcriptional regulator n=1 Tax=uncultured Eudoraea sp. TaxID=1035614 RepID=UPI002623F195|nr:helix-turn-helix transcriptional regulator [uncultured Eudoraea sp.]
MVNTEEFVRRLEKVMNYYGLSASAFADKIAVQRSTISHLLTGRNKPSLEFVLKVVKSFPEVNLYWLLNGKGSFPAVQKERAPHHPAEPELSSESSSKSKSIKKIIIFYEDGSFESFNKNLGQ